MNRDQLQGKWKQLAGVAKAAWGKLTGHERKVIEGDAEHLAGKVQAAFGDARRARKEVEHYVDQLDRSPPEGSPPRVS